MGEGLLYQVRLKIGKTKWAPGRFSWRRRRTGIVRGLLLRIAIRSAINTDIIIG
jgi:hypothetical protein